MGSTHDTFVSIDLMTVILNLSHRNQIISLQYAVSHSLRYLISAFFIALVRALECSFLMSFESVIISQVC